MASQALLAAESTNFTRLRIVSGVSDSSMVNVRCKEVDRRVVPFMEKGIPVAHLLRSHQSWNSQYNIKTAGYELGLPQGLGSLFAVGIQCWSLGGSIN